MQGKWFYNSNSKSPLDQVQSTASAALRLLYLDDFLLAPFDAA